VTVTALALRSGHAVTHLGLFVPHSVIATPGATLHAHGSAIEQGQLEFTLARAKPFGGHPAPWEAAGWQHTFSRSLDKRSHCATLRALHTRQRGAWVAALAVARRPGRGELQLSLRFDATVIERRFSVEVRAARDAVPLTTRWFYGASAWRDGVSELCATVRRALRARQFSDGDRLLFRATSADHDVERVAHCTVRAPPHSVFEGRAPSSMVTRAREGRYATFIVERLHSPHGPTSLLELSPLRPCYFSAVRRRDPQGDWAVCVEIVGMFASSGD
jgi:hypothetical protein